MVKYKGALMIRTVIDLTIGSIMMLISVIIGFVVIDNVRTQYKKYSKLRITLIFIALIGLYMFSIFIMISQEIQFSIG